MENIVSVSSAAIAQDCAFSETLFDRFTSYTDVKDLTLRGYMTGLQTFRRWMTNAGITQPQRDDIKAYKRYLDETGYKAGTKASYLRIVKHFFRWLSSEGIYPDVADNIKGAKVSTDNTKKDAFCREDLNRVLSRINTSTITGLRDYAIIQLCATCALRIIEIQRANIEDLQMMRGEYVLYIQGKGHDEKDDYVKIPSEVYQNINAYLMLRDDRRKGCALFTVTGNRARITPDGSRDERLSEPSLSTIIKSRFKAAGYDMEKLTAHSLRHTGVTALLLANGGNIQQAQRYARHKNMDTTLIYSHNIERDNDTSEQMVFDYLFKGDGSDSAKKALAEAVKELTEDQAASVLQYIRDMKAQTCM